MTVVTAALAFFDEDPADLYKFVHALDGFVDRLVAVDGAYARYPHVYPSSSAAELDALRTTCSETGLPLELHECKGAWPGQLAKRTYLAQMAAHDSDWVFTLDTDHLLRGDAQAFRQELAQVTEDRVEVEFHTPANPERPLAETSATEWHSRLVGEVHRMGLLLRALPRMRYGPFHWWVSAFKNNQRVWLYGGDDSLPQLPGHDLQAPFFIEHRCHFRRDRNIIGNRVFCDDRETIVEQTGQEDVVAA